jgi:hypothetical protein
MCNIYVGSGRNHADRMVGRCRRQGGAPAVRVSRLAGGGMWQRCQGHLHCPMHSFRLPSSPVYSTKLEMDPPGVTFNTRKPAAAYRLPLPSRAKSVTPPAVPARLLTVPPGVIFLMAAPSATLTFPLGSTATSRGARKRAAAPVPSVLPDCPAAPAKLETVPSAAILRTMKLPVSAT